MAQPTTGEEFHVVVPIRVESKKRKTVGDELKKRRRSEMSQHPYANMLPTTCPYPSFVPTYWSYQIPVSGPSRMLPMTERLVQGPYGFVSSEIVQVSSKMSKFSFCMRCVKDKIYHMACIHNAFADKALVVNGYALGKIIQVLRADKAG